MTASLEHRGPDGFGEWQSANRAACLGHTRLAVIDLELGQQPLTDDTGRFCIVFNGEIYNYQALRKELIREGCHFSTNSDTEVVLLGYRTWGVGILEKLNGMFALAIFDARDNSLFVARDRTGIKPLYAYNKHGKTVVASELKAILLDPDIARAANLHSVADLLVFSYARGPKTFYKDIEQVPPGTWVKFGASGAERGRYWEWISEPQDISYENAEKKARIALIESIDDHFVSDVPVGSFLSSGVDSALVCAIASRELGRQLTTYTVGIEGDDNDESVIAAQIAKHLGCDHRRLMLDSNVIDADFVETVLSQFDQPFGDSSAVPSYALSQLISKEVKVVLSGDGGDEVFGGYRRYRHADIARALGNGVGAVWPKSQDRFKFLARLSPSAYRVFRRFTGAITEKDVDRLTWFATYVEAAELEKIAAPRLLRALEDHQLGFYPHSASSQLDGSDYMDITMTQILPDDYLTKVDITSSAHGLEVRVPYLGNQVLGLSASLPKHLKYNFSATKRLSRSLLNSYLPEYLRKQPKRGFSIPLMRVLSNVQRQQLGDVVLRCKILNEIISPTYVSEISQSFVAARWDRARFSEYMVYQRFYGLLAIAVWINKYEPSF